MRLILILTIIFGVFVTIEPPQPASANVIVVDGSCTLMEALEAASIDAPYGGCTAGSIGHDTIVLDVDVLYPIESPLTIDGWPDVTIQAGNANRLTGTFRAKHNGDESYRTFALDGIIYTGEFWVIGSHENITLAIQNSYFDGRLEFSTISSRIIIDNSVISDTLGAEFGSSIELSLAGSDDPEFTGIFIKDSLVNNVTSTDRWLEYAVSEGNFVIENTTFSNVQTTRDLIAIQASASCSANIRWQHVTMLSATQYSIQSGPGACWNVSGSILDIDDTDLKGPIVASNNLTTGASNVFATNTLTTGVDIETTLADNGGFPQTLALIDHPGNPAIDGNPNCGLATDQRGFARDANCDIGAYEVVRPPATDTPTDTPTNTPTATFTSTDTSTPTDTPTSTDTATATLTLTDTNTPSDTPTHTTTDTPTITLTPSITPTATFTSTSTYTPVSPLIAAAACNGPDLAVSISSGDGPFNISAAAGMNMPVLGVGLGTTTILGPEKWDDVTVSETNSDFQMVNLGQFKCRTDERPVPLLPEHRSRTTNPNPLFAWTPINYASNYRVFLFDDKVAANRTVDIRQNSGGPTQLTLITSLRPGRYFWRVRGKTNRVWGLWSVRFTLFVDAAPALVSTPMPTIELIPVPTFPPPPNSR